MKAKFHTCINSCLKPTPRYTPHCDPITGFEIPEFRLCDLYDLHLSSFLAPTLLPPFSSYAVRHRHHTATIFVSFSLVYLIMEASCYFYTSNGFFNAISPPDVMHKNHEHSELVLFMVQSSVVITTFARTITIIGIIFDNDLFETRKKISGHPGGVWNRASWLWARHSQSVICGSVIRFANDIT